MGGRGGKLPKASILPMLTDMNDEAQNEYSEYLSEMLGKSPSSTDLSKFNKAIESRLRLQAEQNSDMWAGKVNVNCAYSTAREELLYSAVQDSYATLRSLGVSQEDLQKNVEFIVFGETPQVLKHTNTNAKDLKNYAAFFTTVNGSHFSESGIVISNRFMRDNVLQYAGREKSLSWKIRDTLMHEWGHAVTLHPNLLKNTKHQAKLTHAFQYIMRSLLSAEKAGWTGKSPIEQQGSYILDYYKKDPIGMANRPIGAGGMNRVVSEVMATSFQRVGTVKWLTSIGQYNTLTNKPFESDELSKYVVDLFTKKSD